MSWLSRLLGANDKTPLPGKVYTIGIVGESHKNSDGTSRQAEIKRCNDGDFVDLRKEPDNPHDKLAVAAISENGRCIGYISRDQNEWIGQKIDDGKIASCRIHAIIGGEKGKSSRGVLLSVRII
ncbi:MAG: HIRAN domain-containing protein [Sphingobium sp.]